MNAPTEQPLRLDSVLPAWMARQRWYAGKGRLPELSYLGGTLLAEPEGAQVWIHRVRDGSGPGPADYQVPLVWRAVPEPDLAQAFVAEADIPELGTRYLYDAPHDPLFTQAVLDRMTSGPPEDGAAVTGHLAEVPGRRDLSGARVTAVRVLSGEQSNTSAVVDLGPGREPLILKVFRVLQDGRNPDVVVQTVLAEHGSTLIPLPVGHLQGSWDLPEGGRAHGDLAFASEFLRDVQDAWQVAVTAADQEFDFTRRAHALGEATARVHATLREALGTTEAGDADRAELARSLRARFDAAADAVPDLAALRGRAEGLYERALGGPWPPLQRVHGDFHLGQVLDVPGRGWVLLDFEGEPLRPLAERNQPDLVVRDIAGMLRSFDYAAATAADQDDTDHHAWARDCCTAFCAGYAAVAGGSLGRWRDLLDALTLDKACYEVVYEARNRPDWLHIPLGAVHGILDDLPDPPTQEPPVEPSPVRRLPARAPLSERDAHLLVGGHHYDPHAVLGAHPHDGGVTVRALRPLAAGVTVLLPDGTRVPMEHEIEGIWAAAIGREQVSDYRLEVTYSDGVPSVQDDPYRFLPTLGEVDLHLIGEGRHEQLWKVLGSHLRGYPGEMGEVRGASFAVWAPNAQTVRLVGDMNHWDGTTLPMRSLGGSGVWEIFVPGAQVGQRYKYEILGKDGVRRTKADPLARATEVPPATASVITEATHTWADQDWMEQRARTSPHDRPMSVYEVHLGSWRQGLSYRDLAEHLVNYVHDLGFTHVEFMPVAEHPYGPSWGYQVTGYYAPTSRFGTPDDFRHLVDRLHQAGIGVIVDWVPAHFPKDAFALAKFDGQALYEHPDPRRGDQPDWGTHVFDFGRPQVRNFLVANAVYWMEEFHIDALRVDAVASMLYLDYSREPGEWEPNVYGGREHLEAVQFLQEANATVYRRCPGVTMIAEESTAWPGVTRPTHLGGLGFGFKWNMGWMHDTLHYMAEDPMYRQYHHHELTFGLVYAFSENYVLPISHDEVVYGKGSLLRKMPGDRWQQLASLRAYLAFMWSHPGKQLLFMGSEFAQESEWADGRSLDWWLLDQPAHWGVHALVKDLNTVYRGRPALWQVESDPAGFAWIEANDATGNTLSYLRYGAPRADVAEGEDDRPSVVTIANFSGAPHYTYRVGLPRPGRWNEVLNTDATLYGGSGVGNMGFVEAEEIPWQGMPCSAELVLPPLAVLWLAQD